MFDLILLPKYRSKVKGTNDYAIISYITLPFYLRFFTNYMRKHQNRETSLLIAKAFKQIGLNVLMLDYRSRIDLKFLPRYIRGESVRVVFGLEPLFSLLSRVYDESQKIYFATGAYWKHQNMMIIRRTDEVNRRKGTKIPYFRLVKDHNSVEMANHVIQIGSKYTIETYPEELREKILLVRQNTFEFLKYDEEIKEHNFDPKSFLYFAGSGAILKGLDLLLEYFSKNKHLNLHVVGYVEKDFQKVFEEELFLKDNIFFHGVLSIKSRKLLDIASRCSFVVLPSASEGCPGSVLHMMRLGMIPIVSRYAAFDDIDQYGFLIKDLSIEAIDTTISEVLRLSKFEIIRLFKLGSEFVTNNFNKETFLTDLKVHLTNMFASK